jgi:hypothetical protein
VNRLSLTDAARERNDLRVPVLLRDRSGSNDSVFCGLIADEASKSADNGSLSSSSFRLFVLLLMGTDCLAENISENWFMGESDEGMG